MLYNIMKENNFIVDRIEGKIIVLEDHKGKIILIKEEKIGCRPDEGDILLKVDNIYIVDKNATEMRKSKIKETMKGMWVE